MSNETSQQPFAEDQPRNTDDKELVGQVLGEETAEEMAELTGGPTQDIKTNTTATDIELSQSEQVATEAAEQVVTPEKRKQEYYNWVEEIDLGKGWIDHNFKFNDDGTVEYIFAFEHFMWREVKSFPESLKKFKGDVVLKGCDWGEDSFKNLVGREIEGDLVIDSHDMEKIPPNILCKKIKVVGPTEKDSRKRELYISEIRNGLAKLGYNNVELEFLASK